MGHQTLDGRIFEKIRVVHHGAANPLATIIQDNAQIDFRRAVGKIFEREIPLTIDGRYVRLQGENDLEQRVAARIRPQPKL
ncbi:MAG: hypothetical protein WBD21_09080, partial [Candidatus Acidiferrales bacterium]